MDPKDFVHLHVHSHYSLLEALPSTKALVLRAKEQGMRSLALTDNGAMYGALEFYQVCEAEDIKPIIGLDMYLAQNLMTDKRPRIDDKSYRLPLLAMNDAGYKNLMKISTSGFLDGFYYKPRTDKEFLKDNHEGLVALSGALRGEIPMALSVNDVKKAEALVYEYQELFGKENFFLELVHHPDHAQQVDMNEAIKSLARETGCPMVVTKNTFYINPEDREGYEAQLCIMRGRTLEAFRQTSTEDVDLSFGTPEEICSYFADVPEALLNTKKIADRVDFSMDLGHNYLPIFPMPEGKKDNDYLHELALAGLKKRYSDPLPPEVQERFEFEYEVITKMGFASYFIIVQDFVNFAKNRGILVGPGRGSAAGSIISYGLRITDLDPLRYGLLFERFLNPDRVSMPDVDMDFADSRRGEVMDYVTQQYGADKVAGIITFGTLKPKAAVRDAARVLGLTFQEADVISKAVPDPIQGRHTPLKIAIEDSPDLRELYQSNPMAQRTIDLAMKLEGNPRHTSQHACGIVIGDIPLVERVPLQAGQREDMAYITQYSLNSAESAGLVKMDFLGLSNLTIIQDALDIIKAVHGVDVDIENAPLDDEATFALLGRGETTGVFQLESDGMKRYIRDLKPTEFEDIVAMVSLYRPGPLSAGMVPQYINRKNGREKVKFDHPLMKDILQETYGVTVYQEQIMKISRVLAGFTAGQADFLRKAMGKKKHDVLAKMYDDFFNGCVKNGVSGKIAKKIWTDWEGFADYAFNKSHAACYAMISYRTAYLKAHYPAEFMAAVMNSDMDTIDRITIEVEECTRMGMHVLPPDVNESYPGFAVVPDTKNIRWGLAAIKNFGEEVARVLVAERKENGEFIDLADFLSRVSSHSMNKKALEALVKAGALDRFEDRSRLVYNLDQMLLFGRQVQKDKAQNQVSMFDFAPSISKETLALRPAPAVQPNQLLSWEKELLGIYVSSHPTSNFPEEMLTYITPCNKIEELSDGAMVRVAGVIVDTKQILTKKKQEPMAFARLEDSFGQVETVIFPKIYAGVRNVVVPDTLVAIFGKVSVRDRDENQEHSILVDKIIPFTEKDLPRVLLAYRTSIWPDEGFEKEEPEEDLHVPGVSIVVPEKPTHDLIVKLRSVFKEYPGKDPVFLVVLSGERKRKIATEYAVNKTDACLEKIRELVGKENVL